MDQIEVVVRRPRKDAARNLQRVLQAAHELFAARGSAVTMEEVARVAGVGVGTVYRRFPTKEHLLAAVTHSACSHTHQCLEEAVAGERDPLRRLAALVRVHYQRADQQAPLLDPQGSAPYHRESSAADEQHQLYESLHHMLHHVILEGQQQGRLRSDNVDLLAALCVELLHPRVYLNVQRRVGGDPEDVAAHVVRFLLMGLGYS